MKLVRDESRPDLLAKIYKPRRVIKAGEKGKE